ncbi:hypothetical protein [Serratia quinivorans]|uniref:hypothetical protein n=1 Tax=Serratia quinivorans TaxID=137545 RepID=UPI00217CA52C|nr:hypothetical protein [Serratia quinivorans]CAI0774215.1 Uncharacterised protein [Serratia quinivorans]CAI1658991.1 Uncharacterised protein [Serratia quinivorans]CAI1986732.1 Uncharacterised protein [Serratia quinivorans]
MKNRQESEYSPNGLVFRMKTGVVEQRSHLGCKRYLQRLPVTFAIVRLGDGADLAYLRRIPNLLVMCPADRLIDKSSGDDKSRKCDLFGKKTSELSIPLLAVFVLFVIYQIDKLISACVMNFTLPGRKYFSHRLPPFCHADLRKTLPVNLHRGTCHKYKGDLWISYPDYSINLIWGAVLAR